VGHGGVSGSLSGRPLRAAEGKRHLHLRFRRPTIATNPQLVV
jgi:hypothetical protein